MEKEINLSNILTFIRDFKNNALNEFFKSENL